MTDFLQSFGGWLPLLFMAAIFITVSLVRWVENTLHRLLSRKDRAAWLQENGWDEL